MDRVAKTSSMGILQNTESKTRLAGKCLFLAACSEK